jgi:hypothetical protein
MATMSRITLSASTDGRPIKVAATAIGSGTTIHTVSTGIDEIDIYAMNSDTVSRKLTLGWGGTTDPDDLIEVTIPAESGLIPVALKLPLKNSLVVKAACSTANVVTLTGGATRIA